MASTYRGRRAADLALWAGTVVCACIIAVILLYLFATHVEFTLTGVATVAFVVFLVLFARLCRNPDTLRSNEIHRQTVRRSYYLPQILHDL